MKTVPAGMANMPASAESTFALCVKMTRRDDAVYGFTSFSRDLTVSGVTYKARTGGTPSQMQWSDNLSVDNLELMLILDSESITDAAIRAGLWDYAAFEAFYVNWIDPTAGIIKLPAGRLGEVRVGRSSLVAEIRSKFQELQQSTGYLYAPDCNVQVFGDARCKVRLNPPVWAALTNYTVRPTGDAALGSVVKPTVQTTPPRWFRCSTAGQSASGEPTWNTSLGSITNDASAAWTAYRALVVDSSVTGVTSRRMFADSTRDEPDEWYDEGKVEFLSGNNAGMPALEIKSYLNAGGAFQLQLAEPRDIQVGDLIRFTAGCKRRWTEECVTKFDNGNNLRGFPHISGMDRLMTGT